VAKGQDGKDKKEDEKFNLDAPEILNLGEEEERKSDDDDTRRFTIKDFKEKAERVSINIIPLNNKYSLLKITLISMHQRRSLRVLKTSVLSTNDYDIY
jgi:hypothetical protein